MLVVACWLVAAGVCYCVWCLGVGCLLFSVFRVCRVVTAFGARFGRWFWGVRGWLVLRCEWCVGFVVVGFGYLLLFGVCLGVWCLVLGLRIVG